MHADANDFRRPDMCIGTRSDTHFNPQYTKPSSSTLFTKLGSSEDPHGFFVISQLLDAVDYSNYVFWVSETMLPFKARGNYIYHLI